MTAYSNFDDVGKFLEKFGIDNVGTSGVGPRDVPADLLAFRIRFMHEELEEFEAATVNKDDAKAFDALLDLAYVVFGTAHIMGYPWQSGWYRVQEANMAKERATKETASVRGGTWDVVKPEGWTPPDIEGLLAEYGF